jgi:hypothetical protein
MSEASEVAHDAPTETPPSEEPKANTAPKSKKQRRPIYVLVPTNIDDLDFTDPPVPTASVPGEDGKAFDVEAVEMTAVYHTYVVPPGPGQKKAVNDILSRHRVDMRNYHRIKMFAGDKPFSINPQYHIRF